MPRKRYRPEDILSKLREADFLIGQGKTVADSMNHILPGDFSEKRFFATEAMLTFTE